MRKISLFFLIVLYCVFGYATGDIAFNLPTGQVFVGMNVQFQVVTPLPGLIYKWNFDDGTPEQTGNTVSHSFKEPKSYKIVCTTLNINGQTLRSEKNLMVSDNRSVQTSAGPFIAGSTVNFTTSNFVENNIKWDFGDGTAPSNAGKTISHTFQNPGNYTVKAYDFGGNTTTFISKSIAVIADNRSINFTPANIMANQEINFTANNFSSNNLKWDFGDGVIQNGSNTIKHTFQNQGNFTVKAYESSKAPNTGVSKNISVSPDNRSINFSKSNPIQREEITITANNFPTNNLKWDFGDGVIQNGSNTIKHKFQNPGNFTVKAYKSSKAPNTGISKNVIVSPDNRKIVFSKNSPIVGEKINFTANNFSSSNIEWDYGDGKKLTNGMSVSYSYARAGQFKIKLKELGTTKPIVEKTIIIRPDLRKIILSPSRIFVGDDVNIRLINSPVNKSDWEIVNLKTIRYTANSIRFQFVDPGNYTIICKNDYFKPVIKKITVYDMRRIIVRSRDNYEGMDIKFEARKFKGNALKWDFGDGQVKIIRGKVSHRYKRAGNYTVNVYDFNGKSKIPITYRINIRKDDRKLLSVYKNNLIDAPLKFKAESFFGNTLKWDFGDGSIFTGGKLVKHLYKTPGVYSIKVTDVQKSGLKPVIMRVVVKRDSRKLSLPKKILAGVSTKIGLVGRLSGDYEWKFEDGTNARGNSLVGKVFQRVGQLKVTLIDRTNTFPPLTKIIKIVPDTRSLTASVESVLPKKRVRFSTKGFLGKSVKWDFGDGTTKLTNQKNISHLFKKTGKYIVTAVDFGGKGKKLFKKDILVTDILPNFKIKIVEFKFNDGKYYKIARKNQYGIDYSLRIKASGAGNLFGKIMVDGDVIGLFELFVNGSGSAYLKKSNKPKLPLTELGMHRLSFEFTNYKFDGKTPVLRYFVTKGKTIVLKSPNTKKIDSKNAVKFIWTMPYRNLSYEYSFSFIPFQFLNDNQIKWKKAKKNSFILKGDDLKNNKFGYLLIRAVDSERVVKTVSKIYRFKIK